MLILISGCSSISIKENIQINTSEDWLTVGANPEKTNTSGSVSKLEPPYEVLWDYYADAGFSKNSLSASDAILFASTLRGEMYAIDISTGKSLGKITSLGKTCFCTPAIYGNNLILTYEGVKNKTIMSYNISSGMESWTRYIGIVKSSPIISGGNIIVANTRGDIYCLDGQTGKDKWIFKPAGGEKVKEFNTSPSVSGGIIYTGNINGYLYAVDINGKEKWKYKTNGAVNSDVSINGNNIYFGSDDRSFYCLNADGSLLWKKQLDTKFLSSSTFYENTVIITGINGLTYSLNKETGEEIWRFVSKGTITASPVLHNDKIFIASYDRNLYCLDAKDGNPLWSHKFEGRLRTTPVIWKDYIFAACEDRRIYCFK